MKKYILIILFILLFLKDEESPTPFFYRNIKNIDTVDELTLINKNNKLSPNYIPVLKKINTSYAFDDKYLNPIACDNFEKMAEDASKLGLKIVAVSAYRSYSYQEKLYNNYVLEKGIIYADMASARPGHSEHQTGLALDIMGSNNDYNLFGETVEFDWVVKNAYKYGFIIRYKKNKEYITGFKYEPWHLRYVGRNVAKYIYENNLTLEEYHAFR